MNTATLTPSLGTLDGGPDLAHQLRTVERRRKLRSLALTLPLLAFLLVVFLLPLGSLLIRAVENPEVADTLVHTGPALSRWDRKTAPPDAAYVGLVKDLSALPETAQAGALARRLNSEVSGARSLIMGTYRALPLPPGLDAAQTRERWMSAGASCRIGKRLPKIPRAGRRTICSLRWTCAATRRATSSKWAKKLRRFAPFCCALFT